MPEGPTRRRVRRSERHQASLPLASPAHRELQVRLDPQDPQGLRVQLERPDLQDRLEPSVQRDLQVQLELSALRGRRGLQGLQGQPALRG